MSAKKGTYALILSSSSARRIQIGKLGTLQVRPGYYVYVGSAFGSGGLRARLAHHRKISDRPRWHIDYLRRVVRIAGLWFTYDPVHREHQWAEVLAALNGAAAPSPGFGSSDCACASHLYFFNSRPPAGTFRRNLHAGFNDHKNIFSAMMTN